LIRCNPDHSLGGLARLGQKARLNPLMKFQSIGFNPVLDRSWVAIAGSIAPGFDPLQSGRHWQIKPKD
jgi:hypothetical protein